MPTLYLNALVASIFHAVIKLSDTEIGSKDQTNGVSLVSAHLMNDIGGRLKTALACQDSP